MGVALGATGKGFFLPWATLDETNRVPWPYPSEVASSPIVSLPKVFALGKGQVLGQ